MKFIVPIFLIGGSLSLLGCKGKVVETLPPQNFPEPISISLNASVDRTLRNRAALLEWSTSNAISCEASGGWSGDKVLDGSATVMVSENGENQYTLSCSNQEYSSSASVVIEGFISESRTINQTIDGQIFERRYLIQYPENPTDETYPVVIFFHGAGGDGQSYLNRHPQVLTLIDEGSFIGVFPDGFQNRWNVNNETSADDVAFVTEIFDVLSEDTVFDLMYSFAVGVSNGAGIVNRIGKETNLLVGIAPLISQQTTYLGTIVPPRTLSVFQVNGDEDDLVPIEGGNGVAGTMFMSAKDSAENWASSFECQPVPVSDEFIWGDHPVFRFSFGGCRDEVSVQYFIVEGAEHTINFGSNFNVHQEVWSFLSRSLLGD